MAKSIEWVSEDTSMNELHYRAINFDLKVSLLRQHYPRKNFLKAYKDIKSFMLKNGYFHRQWSGYRSIEPLMDSDVMDFVFQIKHEFPWLSKCVSRFDVTNIGNVYDVTPIITSPEQILKPVLENYLEKPSDLKPLKDTNPSETKKSIENMISEANAKLADKKNHSEIDGKLKVNNKLEK